MYWGAVTPLIVKVGVHVSCYHPLKGFKIGVNPSGKPQYKITGYDVQFVKFENGVWKECYSKIGSDYLHPVIYDYIDIPCGHCIGCYLDRSRQWADRCMLEAKYHEHNCFITLTYDDAHLPKNGYMIDSDGVCNNSPLSPLVKRDFQLFMKRLRKKYSNCKIRFFACGEYGSHTFRPHYHAILFGVDFSEDRYIHKKNFNGDALFRSPTLESLWSYGFSCIAPVTWQTCAYVSRYCLKKRNNDLTDFYNKFDLTPEFTLMSRKPGIARQYYEDHKEDIYKTEEIYISDLNGSKKLRPPKYFDKLYDIDYPADFENIKNNRKLFNENRKRMILKKTDLDYIDYLNVAEYNLSRKTSIFNERSKINESFV